jgi:hypothetical protein
MAGEVSLLSLVVAHGLRARLTAKIVTEMTANSWFGVCVLFTWLLWISAIGFNSVMLSPRIIHVVTITIEHSEP